MQTIAIIGAGFSGTLTAVHLLRTSTPLRVALFERRGEFGRGVAYGTRCRAHLLNVPAGRMSAMSEDPDHFLRWARETDPSIHGGSFVPRDLYGTYLEWIINSECSGPSGSRIDRIAGEVSSLEAGPSGVRIQYNLPGRSELASVEASRGVLALGNFAPAVPSGITPQVASSKHFIADPWDARRVQSIGASDPVLIVGTGLTMTDLALQLRGQGHRGPIHALSRRGLLPQPHRASAKSHHPEAPADIASWPTTSLGLLKALRREVREAQAHGIDWREVVTSLRADTSRLWSSMGIPEQRRFLTHLRALWDNHRHRSAPEAATELQNLIDSGSLKVWAGRIRTTSAANDGVTVTIQPRGADLDQSIQVRWIINCTGPDTDLSRTSDPLVTSLRHQGLIKPDALGIGLESTSTGAVIDRSGVPSSVLYCIGGLRRPQLWETTAVPELRVQTAALASTIASELSSPTNRPAARC
jgi:uncharacterized NAD(P)/FAD-binding protein YdhS